MQVNNRYLVAGITLVSCAVAFALATGKLHGRDTALTAATAVADSAHRETVAALAIARADSVRATVYKASADSALAVADSERARGNTARADATKARAAYASVRVNAPADCAPLVAAADTALAHASVAQASRTAEASDLRGALLSQQNRGDSLSVALSGLTTAAGRADTALTNVVSATRPSLASRLIPHIGAGVAVGVDATGAPHTIIGVTLGWAF
jgi:hypothetical protein